MTEAAQPEGSESDDLDGSGDQSDSDGASEAFLRAVARAPETARARLPGPGQVLGGRYRIEEPIGAGGFGTVFRAHDQEFERPVAVKVLRSGEGSSLWMFKNEFRALSGLRHPNLVRLHELRAEGDLWYFAMELIDGVDLLAYGASAGPDREALGRALAQVARGLVFLHQRGIVHRDVKPSNVLVTRDGRAVLLDFGLALGPHGDAAAASGTPYYMAPEQARGEAVGPAVDWYALGVVLYRALTGKLPFEGDGPSVLRAKQQRAAPSLGPDAGSLGALCAALLERDPAGRAGAAEVFAELGVAPDADTAHEPLFVGRGRERGRLLEAFEGAGAGAIVALVSGASGVGKSALLAQLRADLASRRGAPLWLASKCHEQEALPYKAIDGAIDGLFRHLNAMPRPDAEALVGDEGSDLAGLFPVLTPFVRRLSVASGERAERRRRAFEAARAVLLRLRRPVVLVIDDAQWADLDSAALLLTLLRAPAPAGLLVVLAYRSGEVARSEALGVLLRSLRSPDPRGARCVEIPVPPLPRDEALALARTLVPEGAERLADEAAGLPLLLRELARGDDGTCSLDGLLRARVGRLPAAAQRLMRLLAVAGVLDARVLIEAAALGSGGVEVVDLLVDEGLARRRPGLRPALEPHHDRIREALLADLDEPARIEAHRALARALSALRPDDEALALHLEATGELAAAAEHAIRAATAAMASLSFERAARLFRRALALLPHDPRRPALLERLSEALNAMGHNADAAAACIEACALVPADEAVRLRTAAADHLLVSGRVEEGLAQARQVLSALGIPYPASTPAALAALATRKALDLLIDLDFRPRDEATLPQIELLRADACANLSFNFGMVDPLRSAYFRIVALHRALALGEPRRVLHAVLFSTVFLAARGQGTFSPRERRALALVRALLLRLPDEQPFLHTALALMHFLHGNTRECCEQALLVERSPSAHLPRRLSSMTRILHVSSLWPLGRWEHLRALYPAYLDDARARDDGFLAALLRGSTSHTFALLDDRPGDIDLDQILSLFPGFRTTLVTFRVLAAVEAALYRSGGRGPDALRAFHGAWPEARRSGALVLFRVHRIHALWAEGRARLASLAVSPSPSAALRRVIRQLRAHASPLSLAYAAALQAGLASLLDPPSALAPLLDAERLASGQGFEPLTLALRLRRARILGDAALAGQCLDACGALGARRPSSVLATLLPGVLSFFFTPAGSRRPPHQEPTMHLIRPSSSQAYAGLRALKMIGEAEGPLGPATRSLLEAAQRQLLHTHFDLDTLAPISADELAAAMDDRALAQQLSQAMALIAVADDVPTARKAEMLDLFGRALRVDAPELRVLHELAHQHMLQFRLDFFRRSHIRSMAEGQLERAGWLGTLKQLASFRGLAEDHALAARYRDLGKLAPDTLGYAFFRHCVDHDFTFPGERYGFPEAGIYHDFSHVLAGYGVTSEEEMLIAAFIAGYRKQDPSFVLLFVMLTFGAGFNMTPLEQPRVQHILATPGLADRFFRALERGGRVSQDLSAGWDPWAWVDKPIDVARRELGIEPE